MFAEFFDDFAFGDEELTGFEVGAGARGIFPGFLGEAGEGIVDPEVFRRGLRGLRRWHLGVFHRFFHRAVWGLAGRFLEEFAEEDGSVAAVTTELDEIAFFRVIGEGLGGETEDFGGLGGGDLVIKLGV